LVKERLIEIEASDNMRNWQPPITGEIIMETFNLRPCKIVGDLKTIIREAIIEGDITNDYDAAFSLLIAEGEKLGLAKN
jgi:poly(A) polymerase